MDPKRAWLEARQYKPEQLKLARKILEEVLDGADVSKAIRRHPQPEGGYLGKHALIYAYRELTQSGEWSFDPAVVRKIRMKPARTLSGVTPIPFGNAQILPSR
jgi:elongator complex protein 3